jgi:hypothetical protein
VIIMEKQFIFWSIMFYIFCLLIIGYLGVQELKCDECGYLDTHIEEKEEYLEVSCPNCGNKFHKNM